LIKFIYECFFLRINLYSYFLAYQQFFSNHCIPKAAQPGDEEALEGISPDKLKDECEIEPEKRHAAEQVDNRNELIKEPAHCIMAMTNISFRAKKMSKGGDENTKRLHHLSLALSKGSCLGVMCAPTDTGMTTLFEILTGELGACSGDIKVFEKIKIPHGLVARSCMTWRSTNVTPTLDTLPRHSPVYPQI